jgi:hypothetical protein
MSHVLGGAELKVLTNAFLRRMAEENATSWHGQASCPGRGAAVVGLTRQSVEMTADHAPVIANQERPTLHRVLLQAEQRNSPYGVVPSTLWHYPRAATRPQVRF